MDYLLLAIPFIVFLVLSVKNVNASYNFLRRLSAWGKGETWGSGKSWQDDDWQNDPEFKYKTK